MPALGSHSGKIDVMGGEGHEPELDLLRDGKITAVNIFAADWEGWAAIDTMNSVFRKTPPVDSGLGWVMADAEHNVPASGPFDPAHGLPVPVPRGLGRHLMTGAGDGRALRVSGLSKAFLGTQALDDVSLHVAPGQIHALIGGNGSGKSTLIKILGGVHRADRGTVTVRGSEIDGERTTPGWARAAGLRFVHQDPTDFPALSVAENLAIGAGYDTTWAGTIAWRSLRRRAPATCWIASGSTQVLLEGPPHRPVSRWASERTSATVKASRPRRTWPMAPRRTHRCAATWALQFTHYLRPWHCPSGRQGCRSR